MQYKLVVVPVDNDIPESVAEVPLPDGASIIESLVHWSVQQGRGYRGGSSNVRISIPRERPGD